MNGYYQFATILCKLLHCCKNESCVAKRICGPGDLYEVDKVEDVSKLAKVVFYEEDEEEEEEDYGVYEDQEDEEETEGQEREGG